MEIQVHSNVQTEKTQRDTWPGFVLKSIQIHLDWDDMTITIQTTSCELEMLFTRNWHGLKYTSDLIMYVYKKIYKCVFFTPMSVTVRNGITISLLDSLILSAIEDSPPNLQSIKYCDRGQLVHSNYLLKNSW